MMGALKSPLRRYIHETLLVIVAEISIGESTVKFAKLNLAIKLKCFAGVGKITKGYFLDKKCSVELILLDCCILWS